MKQPHDLEINVTSQTLVINDVSSTLFYVESLVDGQPYSLIGPFQYEHEAVKAANDLVASLEAIGAKGHLNDNNPGPTLH